MTTEDAKTYLSKREIPRLFESLMTGLMFHRPTDHIQYLIDCLEKAKNNGQVTWNMFVEYKRSKTPLPPITPENGRRPGSRGRRSATPKEEPKPLEESRGAPLPPIGTVDTVDRAQEVKSQEVKATDEKSIVDGIPDVPFVLVMGGPGSGKQTQIEKLMPHAEGWVHISMGELIRKEVTKKGTGEDRWKMIGDLMSRGEMASEEDACELFVSEIQRNKSAKGFIIEGYPRDMKQLEDFEKNVGRVDLVLVIDCEEKFLSTRLLKRGAVTNRIDDNIQAVHKRLLFFKDQTLPVIKYFDDQGKVKIFEGDEDEDTLSQLMVTVFNKEIFGKETTSVQPKVPVPPSEPKPARQRSAKTRTPELDTSESKDLDVPDLPVIPDDMMPVEVKVKDMGRKSGMPECPIIFLAGGPGSGKGTQCKKIVERYPDVVHLSMGDILRTEITTKGTADEKWDMISTLLTQGDMAPEDVTIDLLITNIQKHPEARAFVIEGYPRDVRQLEEFNRHIGGSSFVILLDCEEFYLQERLINRGAASGRPDDNLSAIGKRITFFKNNTLPILKHFDDEDKLVVVTGDRDDMDIFYDIAHTLDYALFGRKPDLSTITDAVQPPTEEAEEGQAPAAGQEESLDKAQQDRERHEETREVVEEAMVAETTTVTGGDGGNQHYSAQLDAAAQEADTDEKAADDEKAEDEKTDEQDVEKDGGQAEAQKEDEEKTDDQQEDGQPEAEAGQTAEDSQQNSEGQQQDTEGQQCQGDESQGQTEANSQNEDEGGQTAKQEEKKDEKTES